PGILGHAIATVDDIGNRSAWWLAVYALVITLGLVALRFVWVWASLKINLYRQRRAGAQPQSISRRLVLATALTGVRGAITLAGILTLPLFMPDGADFPVRGLTIFLAAAVIVLSLVVASIGLPLLLKNLEIPLDPARVREEDRMRALMAQAAIEAINQQHNMRVARITPADADIHADAASRVIALYQRQANCGAADGNDAEQLRKADAAERSLRLAALAGERKAILGQRRQRKIGEETARKLTHELDLIESRYH